MGSGATAAWSPLWWSSSWWTQRALTCIGTTAAPVPAGAGFVDKDEVLALRVQFPDEHVDVTRARPNGTEEDNLCGIVVRHRSHRNGLFPNIQPDIQRTRLGRGWAPRSGGSGFGLKRSWLVASSPAVAGEISLPIGSHDV
jgi:hypothetical protein